MLVTSAAREVETTEVTESRVVLPRFGVALFDDARESGWASLPDGEAMRFNSPQDLRSDCIWVTSADSNQFFRQWNRLHHLRSSEYVSKLSHIAADLGLKVGASGRFGSAAQSACAALSPVIHRAMVLATQAYGWKDPTTRLAERTLQESLRVYLNEAVPTPKTRLDLRPALMSAYQRNSAPSWFDKFRTNRLSVTLRHNRLEYAKRILSTPVPEGVWNYRGSDVDSRFSCSVDQALNSTEPLMVNATVEYQGRDQDLATLAAFGSAAGRSPVLRTWISQRELQWLSKYARIQINGIHVAESLRELPLKVQLPEVLTTDPLFSLSVSAGLVAESHWKALANPHYRRGVGEEVNPWSVWLRAADRAYSFEMAQAVHEAGFFVSYYGNGSVLVTIDRSELPALLEFSINNNIAHPSFLALFEENGLVDA
jgi:hypothetical protein